MPRRPRPPRPLPELPRVPATVSGQAADFEAKLKEQLVLLLGAIPLLLPFLQRLGLREIVNRHVGQSAADHDPGLVVLVLCLNRLLAPRPLVHVETWLASTVLPALLDVAAEQFNDDRLARTLDLLEPHLEAIWQDLVVAAIISFNLDLAQLCYDITSVSFTGAYEQAELVRYGYSRDHRPDLKQIELAMNVTIEGGVPIDYRPLAGNTADCTTPVENMARLRRLLEHLPEVDPSHPPVAPVVVSDKAMLTAESMAEYCRHNLRFLGPYDGEPSRQVLRDVSADELASHPLAYRPQRADRDPSWAPYHGVLRAMEVPRPKSGQPPLRLQGLVVWSPAKARLDAQLRATRLERLEAKLGDLANKLNRRPYTRRETVEKRIRQLLRHHPARPFLDITLDGEDGTLVLKWRRRDEVIAEAAELDGRYLIVTNDLTLGAEAMLEQSKRRDVVEKRIGTMKGPLQVRPVYMHKQERILGMVFCTMVALIVYALVELECTRAAIRQSASATIAQFAQLAMVVTRFTDGSRLQRLSGLSLKHLRLLETLRLPPLDHYCILKC